MDPIKGINICNSSYIVIFESFLMFFALSNLFLLSTPPFFRFMIGGIFRYFVISFNIFRAK